MIDPIKWLLYFPPVRDRPLLKGRVRHFIFMDYDRELNETYVYYKVFILNLCLNAIFLTPYFVSFFFERDINLGLLRINYRPEAAVDELVYSYPTYFFPILAAITIIYSFILFLRKTDYWSKRRIVTDVVPINYTDKLAFSRRPWRFLVVGVFLLATGFTLWTGPEFLRHYMLYNALNDFQAHTLGNFLFFSAGYAFLYTAFYAQALTLVVGNGIRSVLRFHFYGDDILNSEEES